jgi:hypothetical protein
MKRVLVLIAAAIVSLQFFSCSTDYDGSKPDNKAPIINVYDTSDITSSKKTKIQWYGNDVDGSKMTYYYAVTTDTTVNIDNVLSRMPLDGQTVEGRKYWTATDKTFAYISMPYAPFPSETTQIFWIDTLYNEGGQTAAFKAAFSKFFVMGKDEGGKTTDITEKMFRRTNRKPKYPMVFSSKLSCNGYDQNWMLVTSDSAQMVLKEKTEFWQPFDFKWMGEDPDGTDVDLEFRWELHERKFRFTRDDGDTVDEIEAKNDSVLVKSSAGWSVTNLSASFDNEIFDHNPQGKYAFKVFVRDDAFEESELHSTIYFEVFAPKLDKGILIINDTNPTLATNTNMKVRQGNPDGTLVTDFYKSLLSAAGYSENDPDPLKKYSMETFSVATEIIGYDTTFAIVGADTTITAIDTIRVSSYYPNIRKLSEYRLVIIASDDRSNEKGVDYTGTTNVGYISYLSQYLDVGGKAFIVGNSTLMAKYPYTLEVELYKAPRRQVFEPYAQDVVEIADATLDFFKDYFGIYSMSFAETKTWFCPDIWNIGVQGQNVTPKDYYLQDNYDFVGVTPYDHISDSKIAALKVDSAKINDCWFNYPAKVGPFNVLMTFQAKENGTVMTGIPVIEAFKGETVYKYKSIYDLPRVEGDNDTVYDTDDNGTVNHSLKYIDPVTTDGDKSGYILRKSGSVATRYISEGDVFRTAFFTIPLYFLDDNRDLNGDSEGDVTGMFKAMIDWFDLEVNPLNK